MISNRTRNIGSYVLVVIQFGCLAGLLLSGPILTYRPLEITLEIFSIFLVVWAVFAMRKSKITVFPNLKEGAVFIANGPYKLIRHPMYLALLLFSIALVLQKVSFVRSMILLLLVLNMLIKIEFEEKILMEEFKEYSDYIKKTRKLLPFIY
jgi:protein-S-isoprenylcysteine O-methyltransferase Ste14